MLAPVSFVVDTRCAGSCHHSVCTKYANNNLLTMYLMMRQEAVRTMPVTTMVLIACTQAIAILCAVIKANPL